MIRLELKAYVMNKIRSSELNFEMCEMKYSKYSKNKT